MKLPNKGTISVPANTTEGFYQVTIGVDDSAIAAVCGINVLDKSLTES